MTIINPLPNVFVDGQTADGPQVTANFNQVVANVNANAAANGANSDITSLSGLTTPLSVAQGGTGLATVPANHLLTGNGTGALKDLGGTLRGYIDGLTLSAAGGSGTITINAGVAMDSTNVALMTLAAGITKTTGAWAVGSGNGGLDTGAIANTTWYHFYEIERPDTGVVDIIFSLSASAPTLPANYTLYRYIQSWRTDGSAHWLAASQTGDEVLWTTPINDVANDLTLGTALKNYALTVPPGLNVEAIGSIEATNSAVAGVNYIVVSPAQTGATTANAGATTSNPAATQFGGGDFRVLTDTAAHVAVASNQAANNSLYLFTRGWVSRRGRDL